jgi:hypothetical protein
VGLFGGSSAFGLTSDIVVDFNIPGIADSDPVPTNYAGLTWDSGWAVGLESEDPDFSEPKSGDQYAYNAFGKNNLGFSLPSPGDSLVGAWFTKEEVSPTSVKFKGLNASGVVEEETGWLELSDTPQYLAANFSPHARIEVEFDDEVKAYFTMDDIAYSPVPEPATIAVLGLGGLLLRKRK